MSDFCHGGSRYRVAFQDCSLDAHEVTAPLAYAMFSLQVPEACLAAFVAVAASKRPAKAKVTVALFARNKHGVVL